MNYYIINSEVRYMKLLLDKQLKTCTGGIVVTTPNSLIFVPHGPRFVVGYGIGNPNDGAINI